MAQETLNLEQVNQELSGNRPVVNDTTANVEGPGQSGPNIIYDEQPDQPQDIAAFIEQNLNSLQPEQMELLAPLMTPEFAQAVGWISGNPEVETVLGQYATEDIVLVPMSRQEAMASMQGANSPAPQGATQQGLPPQQQLPSGNNQGQIAQSGQNVPVQ